jgi:glycine/D-amino acid oxidase-like deaminating enzyme
VATLAPIVVRPRQASYDVVIVGGAIIGSSVAWWLSRDPGFGGRILVVERDPSYEHASTTGTASCIRHQYSNPVNVRIGLFGSEFIRNFRSFAGEDAPEVRLIEHGYIYLSNGAYDATHRENQATQAALGAATRILDPDEIRAEFPFYNLDGITLGSWNPVGEGWFDGATMFETFRRQARERGVEYVTNEAVGMTVDGGHVTDVHLRTGERVRCGNVVNASGPRAALTARMAGLHLPVEPRKRCLFVFDAQEPLEKTLPLTITPEGVHVRSERQYYLCGTTPDPDLAVDYGDFDCVYEEFDEGCWPILARYIPAFEAIKMIRGWACHYAYNTLDQNAVVGPHPDVRNFLFCNGFSGHGLQQSPAMGRGVAELVLHGGYRTLDLSELGYGRVAEGRPFLEKAVI